MRSLSKATSCSLQLYETSASSNPDETSSPHRELEADGAHRAGFTNWAYIEVKKLFC